MDFDSNSVENDREIQEQQMEFRSIYYSDFSNRDKIKKRLHDPIKRFSQRHHLLLVEPKNGGMNHSFHSGSHSLVALFMNRSAKAAVASIDIREAPAPKICFIFLTLFKNIQSF
ncbi:hypothetical protein NPIL_558291 [Nephila pilipes]|uniref:Uncharacterized protein n=1 Tax=Nephila pilipes TaxID=299642 RepID=A0A8X6PXL6_NEPPI|nr:hypothetical protein NPIL_558291 [Nephila pilipes]